MINVQVKKLRADAVLPVLQTAGAAGMDVCACMDAPLTVAPGARALVPTGLALALPSAEVVCMLCARSGLAHKKGLSLSNGVGIIDSDYRGELLVSLCNTSDTPYTVQPGERIAQMLFLPVLQAQLTEVEALPDTARGAGGFGSTGRA